VIDALITGKLIRDSAQNSIGFDNPTSSWPFAGAA
jgi:hypothetical protein